MGRIAYVNGRFSRHDQAVVHIEDRGYQLADAVYAQASAQQQANASGAGAGGDGNGDSPSDEVIEDADYEVVDEEEAKTS